MPVQIPLTTESLEVYRLAFKNAKMTLPNNNTYAVLTGENYDSIMTAIDDLRLKKSKIKSKSVDHLRIIYQCDLLMKRFHEECSKYGFVFTRYAEELVLDEVVEDDTSEVTDDNIENEISNLEMNTHIDDSEVQDGNEESDD